MDDIEAAIVDVKAKGIRTLTETSRIGAHGKPVIFLHPKDCNGVLLELEQVWQPIRAKVGVANSWLAGWLP